MSNSVLERNVDITVNNRLGTFRKPRQMYSYENLMFDGYFSPTFGSVLFHSLLNGLSSIFEWDGLPEELPQEVIERFLISSGRNKIIRVNSKYYIVHISPQKWNSYYDTVESFIVEPFLGRLNGKVTEKFKNVEIKNNNLGISLIRQVFPFLDTIDEALFNLDINMRALSGKFVYLVNENNETEDNLETENAVNQWFISGKPVKVMAKSMLSDDGNPVMALDVNDSTESFIQTVRFNISQMLNVLGIPNDNFEDKKERKISSEISVQNILQSSIIEDMLNWRLIGVEKLNKEFGLNVSVKVKDAYKIDEIEEQDNQDMEVNDV